MTLFRPHAKHQPVRPHTGHIGHAGHTGRTARFGRLGPLGRIAALAACALAPLAGHALEAHPGDAVAPPPGTSLVGLYAVHQELGPLRVNGATVPGPAARADVGLLRLFHATRLGGLQVNPQLVLPFGRIAGRGTLSGVPSESGIGDLSLLASVMLHQDAQARQSVYLLPGLVLPTGAYDPARLSIGEKRHKWLLQLGAQTPLAANWLVDGYVDVTGFGANDRNPGGTLRQKPLWTLQAYLRHAAAPGIELAAGLRHYRGGETRVGGIDQNDTQNRSALLLTGSWWVGQTTQLMANWGRDLDQKNGFETRHNIELRLLRLF